MRKLIVWLLVTVSMAVPGLAKADAAASCSHTYDHSFHPAASTTTNGCYWTPQFPGFGQVYSSGGTINASPTVISDGSAHFYGYPLLGKGTQVAGWHGMFMPVQALRPTNPDTTLFVGYHFDNQDLRGDGQTVLSITVSSVGPLNCKSTQSVNLVGGQASGQSLHLISSCLSLDTQAEKLEVVIQVAATARSTLRQKSGYALDFQLDYADLGYSV